ncbi:transposase [Francisella sp. SYW-9]|uniref:transposase n=1 Tax=Francisella sp. SYW-9 TaxID=2610888 RepID=UPI00123C8316|nr:transposase [Francisella sp. SYW-9]
MERKRAFQCKNHRLENFDYSQNGYYYVTICTKERVNYFGDILSDGQMTLNDCGKIVYAALENISKFYEQVLLDEFVVMPNHIHAIIIMQKDNVNVGTEQCSVLSNLDEESMVEQFATTTNRVNLSQIIKSYKNICTKQIRNNLGLSDFEWQRSFYDHIIIDEQSLLKIREYIKDNPAKWHLDKYNCENQNEY